jgi:predicted kinase
MSKIQPVKPFLILTYGFPGSGKTYFARQFTEVVQAAHLQADRIRAELFETPRYDQQENSVVNQLMNYMAEEFLNAGVSVVYDTNTMRSNQRRVLSDLAFRAHAQPLVVWFQMDAETAFARNSRRDRRRADDKYSAQWDRTNFENIANHMQNPLQSDDYTVISGKHLFNMQKSAVVSKLRSLGVLTTDDASANVVKPGMVNLVPTAHVAAPASPRQAPGTNNLGRVDTTRRNISIRH